MDKAVELIKAAIHNRRVLFGAKSKTAKIRAVQFAQNTGSGSDTSTKTDSSEILQLKNRWDS